MDLIDEPNRIKGESGAVAMMRRSRMLNRSRQRRRSRLKEEKTRFVSSVGTLRAPWRCKMQN